MMTMPNATLSPPEWWLCLTLHCHHQNDDYTWRYTVTTRMMTIPNHTLSPAEWWLYLSLHCRHQNGGQRKLWNVSTLLHRREFLNVWLLTARTAHSMTGHKSKRKKEEKILPKTKKETDTINCKKVFMEAKNKTDSLIQRGRRGRGGELLLGMTNQIRPIQQLCQSSTENGVKRKIRGFTRRVILFWITLNSWVLLSLLSFHGVPTLELGDELSVQRIQSFVSSI